MSKLKIYSWNVNGLRAVAKKNFFEFVKKHNPNILCLQEIKAQENQLDFTLLNLNNYHCYFNSANRKGYSGVATYSKIKPKKIKFVLNQNTLDQKEGRIIQTDFDKFTLFNIYFPNGKRSKERLNYKLNFYKEFYDYLKKIKKTQKNIVICGDINTAHHEIDLARPKENEKISGFLKEERTWLDKFLSLGFIDSFRYLHPKVITYSWWSLRTRARARNIGWRIDYFYISKNLKKNLKAAKIHTDVMGSDHCPISIELDF